MAHTFLICFVIFSWTCVETCTVACEGEGLRLLCACGRAEKMPVTKRLPKGPREGFMLEGVKMETVTAIPYDIVKEGLQT